MSLFDNEELEEFLLFVRNFNMTITESVMLEEGAKVQYLCTIIHREALRQFNSLYADMKGENPITVENIIERLALYPPPPSP